MGRSARVGVCVGGLRGAGRVCGTGPGSVRLAGGAGLQDACSEVSGRVGWVPSGVVD